MNAFTFRVRATALGAVLCMLSGCKPDSTTAGTSSSMDHSTMSMDTPAVAKAGATKLVFTDYKPYPYPFATCVVSGEKLDEKAVTFVEGDYEIKVRSQADADAFKKSPDQYMAKIRQAYKDAKPNPSTTCVVCGMQLDAGSLPFVYEGRQFQVCDKDELADFHKDPEKYVKIWDDAFAAAANSKK